MHIMLKSCYKDFTNSRNIVPFQKLRYTQIEGGLRVTPSLFNGRKSGTINYTCTARNGISEASHTAILSLPTQAMPTPRTKGELSMD